MLGKSVAALIACMIIMAVPFTLAVSPAVAQVTPSPSVRVNATGGGGLTINVQLPTVPPINTPNSPSPVTVVEQRSGSGGASSWLGIFSSWLWLLLIAIIVLLIVAIIVLLVTRGPRYDEYGPDEGYYEETHRVTRRRRRY